MVPFYLLEMESNRYPIYVDNSNLNSNLTSNFKIKNLTVHVTQAVIKELKQERGSPRNKKAASSVLEEAAPNFIKAKTVSEQKKLKITL